MNRAARRARRALQLAGGFRFSTPEEAIFLEEALALWIHQTEEELPNQRSARHLWGLRRAEKLRQAFRAAIEDRPWRDVAPERDEPAGAKSEDGVRVMLLPTQLVGSVGCSPGASTGGDPGGPRCRSSVD